MIPKIIQLAHKENSGQKGYVHHVDGIVGACTATDYKDPKCVLEFIGGDEMDKNADINVIGMLQNSGTTQEHNNRVHDPDGISPTATAVAGGTHHIKILDPTNYRVRKLTPTEYGRLQGFPMDNWEQVVSNSQAYKQFGNAVTVSVAYALATAIASFLDRGADNVKYVGSKARIAKYIVPIIQHYVDTTQCKLYVEPFVGGANIITNIKHPKRWGFDNSRPLIQLLNHVTLQGELPHSISREQYNDVRAHPENYDDWYVGAVGYLASYNGKYFGGYAGTVHTKAGTVRDYYDEAKRNLEAQAKKLQAAPPYWGIADYAEISNFFPLEDSVIYADPPYEGTTGYGNSFNSSEFWETCRKWAAAGNTVIVSETKAPDDFACIWEKPVIRTLNHNGRNTTTEKLFIRG